MGMDQGSLARKVGVSRQWIVEAEKGKPRAEVGLMLRTLNALGVSLDICLDDGTRPRRGEAGGAPDPLDIDAIVERARGGKR